MRLNTQRAESLPLNTTTLSFHLYHPPPLGWLQLSAGHGIPTLPAPNASQPRGDGSHLHIVPHTISFSPLFPVTAEWLVAVQALMVLALLFSSFSFILFMCQLYTMERGGLFYATGIFQIFACECPTRHQRSWWGPAGLQQGGGGGEG